MKISKKIIWGGGFGALAVMAGVALWIAGSPASAEDEFGTMPDVRTEYGTEPSGACLKLYTRYESTKLRGVRYSCKQDVYHCFPNTIVYGERSCVRE